MSNGISVPPWLLVDHKDTLDRELSGGFSVFERKGQRTLQERPRCPICRRPAWPKAVTYMERVSFTGLHIGDAAWGNSMTFIVSRRFVEHWCDGGLNGLEFSAKPVVSMSKRRAVFAPHDKEFFLAIPEPRMAQFDDAAEALYTRLPPCSMCSSSEVGRLSKLCFQPATVEGSDCCLPSCLPGWVLVSSRFLHFVEEYRLMNFNFIESFERLPDRKLIRRGYWRQLESGQFERFAECSEEMLSEIRGC